MEESRAEPTAVTMELLMAVKSADWMACEWAARRVDRSVEWTVGSLDPVTADSKAC
jgi:hypothetical protein